MRLLKNILLSAGLILVCSGPAGADDTARLIAAMMGDTPMIDDLRALTDEIGGRPTGSDANRRSAR